MQNCNHENNLIDNLTTSFSRVNINTCENMEAVAEQIAALQAQIQALTLQVNANNNNANAVEEYAEIQPLVVNIQNVSLDMFKTLPEFNGDRNKYCAWRTSAKNVIKIFGNRTNEPKYFEALNIIRNKITGVASDTLTNYNTVFNFDAIIARLDFTYADKRPIYIIEQEMIVLQQKHATIEEFYDEVNKKLNTLINKINMTHRDVNVAKAMIGEASNKALRTFITGLRGNLGQILYASNPATLPDAYAKIQTIVNDQERIKFANQFNNATTRNESTFTNPNFMMKQKKPLQQSSFKPSYGQQHPGFKPVQNQQQSNFKPYRNQYQPGFKTFDKPTPMDIDRSSMNVNVSTGNDKRPRSGEFSNQVNQRKFQRINQMQVLEEDDQQDEETETNEYEYEDNEENEEDNDIETSSVFLGKQTDCRI